MYLITKVFSLHFLNILIIGQRNYFSTIRLLGQVVIWKSVKMMFEGVQGIWRMGQVWSSLQPCYRDVAGVRSLFTGIGARRDTVSITRCNTWLGDFCTNWLHFSRLCGTDNLPCLKSDPRTYSDTMISPVLPSHWEVPSPSCPAASRAQWQQQ